MEKIKLDLIPSGKMPSLHASQYDDGRDYHIDLTENRVPYTLDGTETISLTVRKCDNTLVTMDIANTFAGKSYIEFRTTEQMNACAGFNYGEITIEKNGTQISSLNFYLQVEGAPDEGGIQSQSEINNLKRQVHDAVVEELKDNGASDTGYDNTESGLEATNVQDAIDEVNTKIENIPSVDAYTKEESDQRYATKTALEEVANAVDDKADETEVTSLAGEIDNISSLLNYSKGDSTSVNTSFVGYQRKTIFANVELKANVTYYFRIAFATANEVQGYYAVSKTDNTTPDYAWTNLLGKKTADFTYTPNTDLTVNITARFNASGTYAFDCSYAESKSVIYSLEDDLIETQNDVHLINSLNQPFKYKKRYDHMFSTRTGVNCTIPMQSLFHVRLSKKFGFDVIEGNVNKTSDGKYFVHHMAADDKFGNFFHHVDGVTDISNIVCTTVTWDWIKQNVRYNSSIAKYQTRPCSLEEFLGECRQQELMPMLEIIDLNVVAIADKILGKGNYIAYGGTRSLTPNAIMYQWKNLATKQEILEYCEQFGTPMIYGMALPTRFTDEELQDIINSLHEKGYQIGVSYVYEKASDYFYKGVDVDGAQNYINRIESGNLCNYDATFGFDDFNFTNATETDGVLTYSSNGTFAPDIANTVYQFCAIDIELLFDGTINVPAIGEASAVTITSDGTKPCYFAIPIINGSPLLTISVDSGTKIIDAKFKASVV